jgi:iron complex transport system ATP-binding protein
VTEHSSSTEPGQDAPSTGADRAVPSHPPLRAEAIHVHLDRQPVLSGIDLELTQGARIAVVGPNGCGKSTLLRSLAGLIPLRAGRVLLGNSLITQLTARQVARHIAYMPQKITIAFPLSALEVVLLGRHPFKRGLGLAEPSDVELARMAMSTLDVWPLRDRPVTALSGGEIQRILFARTLVQDCPIMLLDEPTSAQDPRGTQVMIQEMRQRTDKGAVVLAVVHDLNLAARHFDWLLVMQAGTITARGSPRDVIRGNALERAFQVKLRLVEDEPAPIIVCEGRGEDVRAEG